MTTESGKDRVLRSVRNSKLPHPHVALIEAFLNDAVNGEEAARHLLKIYAKEKRDPDFFRFLEDWEDLVKLFHVKKSQSKILDWALKNKVAKRDDHRCCLSGAKCWIWSFWNAFPIVPPTAFSIQEVWQHLTRSCQVLTQFVARLYDMLRAFTSPYHQSLLEDLTLKTHARNCWTLSTDAALAISNGVIRLERLAGTEYEILYNNIGGPPPSICTPRRLYDWKCDLADYSNSGFDCPDPDLIDLHSRFSRALKWRDIANTIKSRPRPIRNPRRSIKPSSSKTTDFILDIWPKVPDLIRVKIYKVLRTAGSYLYGESLVTEGVQRLPFGMYLKYGIIEHAERHAREFNALKILRAQTSIPVPRPIDLLISGSESFLVTSRIEGEPVGLCVDECSDEEMDQMAQDLRYWIAEMRAMKKEGASKYAITNTSGGPCSDYRIDSEPIGPFHTEKEFSEFLKLGILPNLCHESNHKIVFTHADLNMRNILAKNGRITGIVDWENAGWFPEYWEFTKCHFSVHLHKRWLEMIDTLFENKYQSELAIERQYWEYHSAW